MNIPNEYIAKTEDVADQVGFFLHQIGFTKFNLINLNRVKQVFLSTRKEMFAKFIVQIFEF